MEPTKRQITAFGRFLELLPHGKDLDLVILKGHLLIEEQIKEIVRQRLLNPSALDITRMNCHQAICLAQALLPRGHQEEFWMATKKLNELRNNIAHKLTPTECELKINEFISCVPVDWEGQDKTQTFELCIWSLFVYISSFVEGKISEDMEMFVPKPRAM
ncbi:hypothetical protein ACH50O_17155 [Methylomonas sp. 2BW1-5-20]|uniref:hypothetical protein n=1 Tax=Methylomonas sp. 2BW1-5-20 TaxID=3376686 RepID=UPI004051CA80